jgi:KaiC/GvpD/RAD55 family RecA-like ATPase
VRASAEIQQPQSPEIPDHLAMLLRFLETPGDVLLVQGQPGTGKTTLALEILRNSRASRKVYASSRTSPTKLRQHFPFLDEVIDSMSGRIARSNWASEFQDLRGPESDTVFNKVLRLKHAKETSLMVIDSWEGALKNATDDGRGMLESAVLSELEDSKLSMVIVAEGQRIGDLGHLVDGIVSLCSSEIEGRITRTLIVNKMRGQRVMMNRGLFSLDGGRFTFVPYKVPRVGNGSTAPLGPLIPHSQSPIPHSQLLYSTGSPDLDEMLGGGVKRGSFTLIDVDSNVPPDGPQLLLNTMRANFLNQGGSCFSVPVGGFSSEYVADSLRQYIGTEALEERVRIAEFDPDSPARKWKVPLKGRLREDSQTFLSAWTSLSRESPKMLVVDYDRMQQVYGEDQPFSGLSDISAEIRDSGALNIGLASRHTRLREGLVRTADYHLRLISNEGSMLMFGVKPYTPISGARFEDQEGMPSFTLSPMV